MSAFKDWNEASVAWHNQQVAAGKGGGHSEITGQGVEKESDLKESDLHDEIYDYCRGKGFIALHSSMAERTTRNKGEWDYTIIGSVIVPLISSPTIGTKQPRIWFLECKSKDGKLTHEQQAMIAHAEWHGHKVHVVRSMADVLKALV